MAKVYTNKNREIAASVGEPFVIELESNPTTGYEWQLDVDESRVKVVGRQYRRGGEGVGAGGSELFTLQPVKSGDVSIRAEYKRAWEASGVESREFRLHVED
jgi:inhibitor of cysteine peptidase